MVSYKTVGGHEERQSLFYSRYQKRFKKEIYSFIFAHMNKHYFLLMSLHHLWIHGHLPLGVLYLLLNTQMPLYCLFRYLCPSKTGDKSYSIKTIILYVYFLEFREQDIISPGNPQLPTVSAGILEEDELSISSYLHFLIYRERQWHDHLSRLQLIPVKETQRSYFIVIMAASSPSKTG